MQEKTEHHLGERVVVGPIPTLISYAYIAACTQSEIAFPQIAGGEEVALPHLLNPKCMEAVPEQADVKSVQSHPKGTFILSSTNLHGGGMLCAQAGGRRALSWPSVMPV